MILFPQFLQCLRSRVGDGAELDAAHPIEERSMECPALPRPAEAKP